MIAATASEYFTDNAFNARGNFAHGYSVRASKPTSSDDIADSSLSDGSENTANLTNKAM